MSYTGNKLVNPSLELPYQLLDTIQSTGFPMGLHKATGSFQFINVLGFKIGGGQRIENCTITIPNASYSTSFGISTNWDLVGYFPTSDINITAQGIGRSGYGDLGGGWISDVCGFYLNINQSTLLNADKVIIEYDFFTDGTMKQGVGFFQSTAQPSGQDGGPNYRYCGTWDNSLQIYLPTVLTPIAYVNRSSFSSGTRYTRKVTLINKL